MTVVLNFVIRESIIGSNKSKFYVGCVNSCGRMALYLTRKGILMNSYDAEDISEFYHDTSEDAALMVEKFGGHAGC